MAPPPRTSHENSMPQFSRIAAVTGANKGIGLAVVRNLALQYPSSQLNDGGGPLLIYLCARDRGRGEEAVRTLENDSTLRKAKVFARDGGLTTVKYHGLDISQTKSILDFAGFLEKEHPEGIDMVVNNAGIAMNGFGMMAFFLLLNILFCFSDSNIIISAHRHQRREGDSSMQLLRHPHGHTLPPALDPSRRPPRERIQHVRPPQLQILQAGPRRVRRVQDRRRRHQAHGVLHRSRRAGKAESARLAERCLCGQQERYHGYDEGCCGGGEGEE